MSITRVANRLVLEYCRYALTDLDLAAHYEAGLELANEIEKQEKENKNEISDF